MRSISLKTLVTIIGLQWIVTAIVLAVVSAVFIYTGQLPVGCALLILAFIVGHTGLGLFRSARNASLREPLSKSVRIGLCSATVAGLALLVYEGTQGQPKDVVGFLFIGILVVIGMAAIWIIHRALLRSA